MQLSAHFPTYLYKFLTIIILRSKILYVNNDVKIIAFLNLRLFIEVLETTPAICSIQRIKVLQNEVEKIKASAD